MPRISNLEKIENSNFLFRRKLIHFDCEHHFPFWFWSIWAKTLRGRVLGVYLLLSIVGKWIKIAIHMSYKYNIPQLITVHKLGILLLKWIKIEMNTFLFKTLVLKWINSKSDFWKSEIRKKWRNSDTSVLHFDWI